MMITAMALKRYELRHGTLPETLRSLVPGFLEAVPIDLMDGQPLRYRRREGGGFLLYSVGSDGIDQGEIQRICRWNRRDGTNPGTWYGRRRLLGKRFQRKRPRRPRLRRRSDRRDDGGLCW